MDTLGNSFIAGIGAYLPAQRVSSDSLMAEVKSARFGIPEDYISRHIGIMERRVAEPGQQPSDLATLASESALLDADAKADEIDLIIFAGITRDYEEPSTAHNVQHKLGATRATCLDVSNACLGVMTGLSIADAYIRSRMANTVLVCTGETLSRVVADFIPLLTTTKDKRIFKDKFGFLTAGDAGGALLLQRSQCPERGWQWFKTESDGAHSQLCYYQKSGNGHNGQITMDKICSVTLASHMKLFDTSTRNLSWFGREADKTYCHQVGASPHKWLFERLELDLDKAPISYDKFGNLTTATIPVLMHLDRPTRDQKVQFFCSGSGISVFQGGMVF
jgi:3-oxoacyl-[acyl-carrier-protein] synthase III